MKDNDRVRRQLKVIEAENLRWKQKLNPDSVAQTIDSNSDSNSNNTNSEHIISIDKHYYNSNSKTTVRYGDHKDHKSMGV